MSRRPWPKSAAGISLRMVRSAATFVGPPGSVNTNPSGPRPTVPSKSTWSRHSRHGSTGVMVTSATPASGRKGRRSVAEARVPPIDTTAWASCQPSAGMRWRWTMNPCRVSVSQRMKNRFSCHRASGASGAWNSSSWSRSVIARLPKPPPLARRSSPRRSSRRPSADRRWRCGGCRRPCRSRTGCPAHGPRWRHGWPTPRCR